MSGNFGFDAIVAGNHQHQLESQKLQMSHKHVLIVTAYLILRKAALTHFTLRVKLQKGYNISSKVAKVPQCTLFWQKFAEEMKEHTGSDSKSFLSLFESMASSRTGQENNEPLESLDATQIFKAPCELTTLNQESSNEACIDISAQLTVIVHSQERAYYLQYGGTNTEGRSYRT